MKDPDWRMMIGFLLRCGYSRAAITQHGGLTKIQITRVMEGHGILALYTTGQRTIELYKEATRIFNSDAEPIGRPLPQ